MARSDAGVTIYHNPACGTSRNALQALRDAGVEPTVVRYLNVGWSPELLRDLLARMKLRPRDILRLRGAPAEDLALAQPDVADETILAAMVARPVLVERPIVSSPKGVLLCRPWEKVRQLLQ